MYHKTSFFRLSDGREATLYTLSRPEENFEVSFSDWGATIIAIGTPDRNNEIQDVVLRYLENQTFEENPAYFGATIGRVANRISNGTFQINGREYHIPHNRPGLALHGGPEGFNARLWQVDDSRATLEEPELKFSLFSPDGDQGCPGNLNVEVTMTLEAGRRLKISYQAVSDQTTPVNLTNHSYFNLGGACSNTLAGHEIMIDADAYTEVDAELVPTGNSASVTGTALDLRTMQDLEVAMAQLPTGYDHNFVLNDTGMRLVAKVHNRKTGISMQVYTTEIGLQFYSGFFMDEAPIYNQCGELIKRYGAFCLETQHFPDSPNHPEFPSIMLEPGSEYAQTTVYEFSN